jgi:hypothetical protein
MPLSKDQLAELEEKHGRIAHVVGKAVSSFREPAKAPTPSWEVVYRRPRRAEYKLFRANANNPARKADALEILARQCVVHPPPEAFDALLDEYPAIAEASSDALMDLTSMSADDSGK